ncbi:hypothetical protein H0256_01705 [Pectobacterium brasiliense]|nr:hypothetical protein [Pectobacterium brasiliense]
MKDKPVKLRIFRHKKTASRRSTTLHISACFNYFLINGAGAGLEKQPHPIENKDTS